LGWGCWDSSTRRYQTLIVHWNGRAWKVQPSPSTGAGTGDDFLLGVAATSRRNAWAVGRVKGSAAHARTLIEHWNGKAWKIEPSPNTGSSHNILDGVAATSSANAWAVGAHYNGSNNHSLIEHWNGKAWKIQKTSRKSQSLNGVAAASSSSAWAVGYTGTIVQRNLRTLALHWNGTSWTG
jgi:hypothetical protein